MVEKSTHPHGCAVPTVDPENPSSGPPSKCSNLTGLPVSAAFFRAALTTFSAAVNFSMANLLCVWFKFLVDLDYNIVPIRDNVKGYFKNILLAIWLSGYLAIWLSGYLDGGGSNLPLF